MTIEIELAICIALLALIAHLIAHSLSAPKTPVSNDPEPAVVLPAPIAQPEAAPAPAPPQYLPRIGHVHALKGNEWHPTGIHVREGTKAWDEVADSQGRVIFVKGTLQGDTL